MLQIDLEQRRDLVRGSVACERFPDGGLRFSRLTPALKKIFKWDYMYNCMAGVRIAMLTDASALTLKVAYGKPFDQPDYLGEIDIVADEGEPMTFCAPPLGGSDREDTQEIRCEFDGETAERRIVIHLNGQVPSRVLSLELETEHEPKAAPYPAPWNILFLGDSITQGYFASPAKCFATRYARSKKADFHNVSIGGAQLQGASGTASLVYPWNELLIAFGVNDCNAQRDKTEFEAAARQLLDAVTKREGAKIELLTPVGCPEIEKSGRSAELESFRQILKKVAADFPSVRLLDGPGLLSADDRYFMKDGVHPNETGMEIYAQNLIQALK